MFDRVRSVCDLAEPLLGLDRSAGQKAWIRVQPGGRLFVTASPSDTLFHPSGHPRAGHARYRWERQPDGSEFGYLIDGS
jgi:hypothetical protein